MSSKSAQSTPHSTDYRTEARSLVMAIRASSKLDTEKATTALLKIIDKAIIEAKLELLDDLLVTGHTAERASVPNTDESMVWDKASWVSIQAPIFYTFAATIERHKQQLNTLKGQIEEKK